MNNVLLLMAVGESGNDVSDECMNKTDRVTRFPIYRSYTNIFIRLLRRIWRDLNLPGYQIWFDKWWKEINSYDTVIAIAYKSTYKLFKIMKKKCPQIRRIMYWWDPVMNTISPLKVKDDVCEKWSFCKSDSNKYNLRYNPTFLPIDLNSEILDLEFNKITYDVMFVGSVCKTYHNRLKILLDFSEVCEKKGVSTSIHVLYHDIGSNRPFEMKSLMEEKDYYDLLKKSRAVLDIVEPENEWMTLRPVEALFFHKKLITNNVDLIEEPLYHPDSVFILGRDDINLLPDFLALR